MERVILKASFVIPCFQSTAVLEKLVLDLTLQARDELTAFEIVLVRDSTDPKTASLLKSLAENYPETRVIGLSRNFGQHAATVAGIVNSFGEIIVTLDDDYQHQPSDALKMVTMLDRDSSLHLIYATPIVPGQTRNRSKNGRLFRRVLRLAGLKFAASLGPFRAFRGSFREAFRNVNGPIFSVDVILSWVVNSVQSFPCNFNDRSFGKSGYTQKSLTKLAFAILVTYTIAPLQAGIYLGLAGVMASLFLATITLGNYVYGGISVPGFATTTLLVLFLGSLQLVVVGVIGIYVGHQHRRSIQQPPFFIYQPQVGEAGGSG